MKSVFIAINDMEGGGAQRSLLSFLECFAKSGDIHKYSIDLMVFRPVGMFIGRIPKEINVLKTPKDVLWMGSELNGGLIFKNFGFKEFMGKVKWQVKKYSDRLNEEQKLWENWKDIVSENPKEYDVAISYMNGCPNYYVVDKVKAKKKVLWIHNEYKKIGYDKDYDQRFYEAADEVITISDICVESFAESFPNMREKVSVLENITINDEIFSLAEKGSSPEFGNAEFKIVSVGSVREQKAYDKAVLASFYLKKRGIDFVWVIIGGGDAKSLIRLADEKGLSKNIIFAGA
ncbi:MAG: glycosyltransferase, partial [Eubacterium sp.]|nr:glycosyltransferase [Eubacterium sp.]